MRVPIRRIRVDGETPKKRQHCLADSSAPASTLAAKPMVAYHFIASDREGSQPWLLYHAPHPWFTVLPHPTFLGG
jgi:hypothetical protein